MKNLLILLALVAGGYFLAGEFGLNLPGSAPTVAGSDVQLQQAFVNQRNDLQIEGTGHVVHILPDDLQGSRHQRFLIATSTGQTLLVAHNIDLAPRIANLVKGDRIEFFGEYEWNAKGGVIHWTHHDPSGRHVDGWLKHQGHTYQ